MVRDYVTLHSGKGVSLQVTDQWEPALVWLVSALYDAHVVSVRGIILLREKDTVRGTLRLADNLEDGQYVGGTPLDTLGYCSCRC
jgi:hypothetical protein